MKKVSVLLFLSLFVCYEASLAGGGKSKKKIGGYANSHKDIALALNPPTYKNGKCVGCSEEDHVNPVFTKQPLCNLKRVTNQWRKNCVALMRSGIPKDALTFALQTLLLNDTSFGSSRCLGMASSGHYSMKGMTRGRFKSRMSRGLPNKCQFIINDVRKSFFKNSNTFKTMYYIDLCSSKKPIIIKDYFALGYGTVNTGRFTNRGGNGTTTLGAFFTNSSSFNMHGTKSRHVSSRNAVAEAKRVNEGRKSIRSSDRKRTALQLFGLQNTNNHASRNYKYMHVAMGGPTAGCVGVAPRNYWMMENLAKHGPSMVINYGPKQNMEDIRRCTNVR